jgi:ketosteroid isomerase-like protein
MPGGNVEIVERAMRAFAERDYGALESLFHAEFEYQGLADWPGESRDYGGLEEFRRRMTLIDDEFDAFRNEPLEYVDAGERIVVVTEISGIGRRSGAPVRFREAFVFTIGDGRIARMEACGSRERALELAGTPE